jgi:carbon-monoxide dehydrogenase medium subunit
MHTPTPGLPRFDYVKPTSLSEACRFLVEHDGEARPLMGGTDVFARMRDGFIRPRALVDVKHLPGMRDIVYDEQAGLTIGAAATMNQVACHPDVLAHYPSLAEAARSVASYQLRNRATLGGNLCNASPCADSAPAALVLEARVVLHGTNGAREVPINEFFTGPGQTVMQAGELMTAIRAPVPPASNFGRYIKLGRNKMGDLAVVGVAVLGFPDATAPSGHRFRVALGSVAPLPLRAPQAEEILAANALSEETLALAADAAMETATPISDVRAGAVYQKAMVRTLTLRGLRDVWKQLQDA